ncbi:MAG: hypothetical protein VKI82_06955 [Leptolyngbya sp.]|nr:hypothetical protein [Leptolyngbya sp.]
MKSGYPHRRGPSQPMSQCGALEPPTLSDLDTQVDHLTTRIQHLQTGIRNLRQLQDLNEAAKGEDSPSAADELAAAQAEIAQLQQVVDDFELSLASHLLSWKHLQEPFWQAVRYGGLGLVMGWVLHWLVRG